MKVHLIKNIHISIRQKTRLYEIDITSMFMVHIKEWTYTSKT